MDKIQKEIMRKRRVLDDAEKTRNINKTCRYFGAARPTLYLWRQAFRERGETARYKDHGRRSAGLGPWHRAISYRRARTLGADRRRQEIA